MKSIINFNDFFEDSVEFSLLKDNIASKNTPQAVFGLEWGSFVMQTLALWQLHGQLVVVVANETDANQLLQALSPFVDNLAIFSKLEITFFEMHYHSHQTELERLNVIYDLIEEKNGIIIMPVDAMLSPLVAKKLYQEQAIELMVGTEYDVEDLLANLISYGYTRTELVERVGEFTVRGGVLDVFSPRYEYPLRIEFFDNEVDSIRFFDLENLRSVENINSVIIKPCSEGLIFGDDVVNAKTRINKLMAKAKGQQLEKLTMLEEALLSNMPVDGQYKYLPLFLTSYATIFDYINCPILVWRYNRIYERNQARYDEWIERFKQHFEQGEAFESQLALMLSPEQFSKRLFKSNLSVYSLLKTMPKELKPVSIIDFHFREATSYGQKLALVARDINHFLGLDYRLWIMIEGESKVKGVRRFLEDNNIKISNNLDTGRGIFIFEQGFISGFITDSFKALVITEKELYGNSVVKRKRKLKHAKKIKAFTDLSVGDYVVHNTHGIGKYLGIFQLAVDGKKKDFLKISYRADDLLYIPVENMESLQKYLGAEVSKVRLSKLGGTEWSATKTRAKKAVEDMTDELIALYAKRQQAEGFAFSPDSDWQNQFEAAFPYRETPDQLKCIAEIKADMEKARPMDRLLCGDVGYGKTEVALRAVFKAINDSKQVAILVPTTVLAQQHYDTIVHRFASYPAGIGVLSRFRSRKEIKQTIEDVRTGVCDILIGTHRMLSEDVKFKDLGLLVIDEEQRFGVKLKEKIKQLKHNIDVLTLTATPIPRTLHMSLSGIRDLSTIEDPPEDRYPIQTYVLDYQPSAIREAILRELDRGGQVYFVHNRVSDIERVTANLMELVPEARIAYAHGQMREGLLEQRMYDFMNGEFDVLISTTIVETGLDIANVNTMIIHDADRFGLAQLYQLRGRVGRSNRLAYAYLTYSENKILSELAEKRLKVIKEFTDVGSGFKIAMRDLELRGAGSILGSAQSGHMMAVGYEMYCKLIEEAIGSVKGDSLLTNIDTQIEIPCEAYIPEYYIDNAKFKIDLYKRISAIKCLADKEEIEDDLFDLYGSLPQSVGNLINIGYARAIAEKAQFTKVSLQDNNVILTYSEKAKIDPLLIGEVLSHYSERQLKFVGSNPSYFSYTLARGTQGEVQILEQLKDLLRHFEPD